MVVYRSTVIRLSFPAALTHDYGLYARNINDLFDYVLGREECLFIY